MGILGGITVISKINDDEGESFKWNHTIHMLLTFSSEKRMAYSQLESKILSTYQLLSQTNNNLTLTQQQVKQKIKNIIQKNPNYIQEKNNNVRLKT